MIDASHWQLAAFCIAISMVPNWICVPFHRFPDCSKNMSGHFSAQNILMMKRASEWFSKMNWRIIKRPRGRRMLEILLQQQYSLLPITRRGNEGPDRRDAAPPRVARQASSDRRRGTRLRNLAALFARFQRFLRNHELQIKMHLWASGKCSLWSGSVLATLATP